MDIYSRLYARVSLWFYSLSRVIDFIRPAGPSGAEESFI
jgi:hypothetical protein